MYGDADGGGGGYFNAETSFSGASPQVSRKGGEQKRAQNIFPVTARQVLTCSEDGLRVGNVEVYLVTLVGLVKAVENSSVKVTYHLEDDTGCIEATHWIDGDDGNTASEPVVVENTYCRVSGTIKFQGAEKRYIMVFNIQQLMDLNEITSHRLEVALFSKKAELIDAGVKDEPMASKEKPFENGYGAGNGLSNSMIATTAVASISTLSAIQQQVLRVIQQCPHETGMDVNDICPQLGNKISQSEVNNAVEFLAGEGHIYTTVDDNHFRTTDGC